MSFRRVDTIIIQAMDFVLSYDPDTHLTAKQKKRIAQEAWRDLELEGYTILPPTSKAETERQYAKIFGPPPS